MAEGSAQASVVGKIKSVHCENFVTFSEIVFHPQEYLNIVMAPNGCGKSTMVAAIVLCLGGEPVHLSRANKIETYIKNGEVNASISVEVYSDEVGGTDTFKRSFNSLGKSEYRINARISTKAKLLEAVRKYSIQVTNLCQLLPQDRVHDFAKMNSHDLLENTIASVCSADVIENFDRLKELRKAQLQDGKQVAVNKKNLEEARQHLEQVREQVEAFQARRELSSKVEVGAAKRLWLETEQLQLKITDVKKDVDKSKKNLSKYQHTHKLAKANERTIKLQQEKLASEMNAAEEKKMAALRDISNQQTLLSNTSTSHNEKKLELNRKRQAVRQRDVIVAKEVELLDIRARDYESKKKEVGPEEQRLEQEEEHDKRIKTLNEKIRNLSLRHGFIQNRIEEDFPEIQVLRGRIEKYKNRPNKKLKFLKEHFPMVHQGILWLDEHRHLFRGRVYNPIILEIEADEQFALYVENVVPMRDLCAFVCEDKCDLSRLVTELCTNQRLSINVGHSAPATSCEYRPPMPIANLRKYGFTAYTMDLVRGPPAILNYLCSLFQLHNIPIGDESVNSHTDAIPRTIRNYYGGDKRFNLVISKYSGEGSLSTIYIRTKNLLAAEKDNTALLEGKLQCLVNAYDGLKNERTTIERQVTDLENEREDIRARKSDSIKRYQSLQMLKGQLKRQKIRVEELKSERTTIEEIDLEFKNAQSRYVWEAKRFLKEILDKSEVVRGAVAAYESAEKKNSIFESNNALIIHAVQEASERLRNAEDLHRQVEAVFERDTKNYQTKLGEALASTKNCRPNDRKFPNKELYNELPNTIEELDNAIDEYAARLDCMAAENKNILEVFHKKQLEVKGLEAAIEDAIKNAAAAEAQMKALYTKWSTATASVIESLNTHFSAYMAKLNYTGEVQLAKESEYDFDSYGIRIMVKFRQNVAMEPLSRTRQSGGERAVTIAMYTLAMQHLTHVPFRCVDEINQGMDPTNEEKVFNMLMEETTKTGSSQYFYITPKMGENMPESCGANRRVCFHIVFNGNIHMLNT